MVHKHLVPVSFVLSVEYHNAKLGKQEVSICNEKGPLFV